MNGFQFLEKVRDFIEVMAKANKDLEMSSRDNTCPNFDIEVLDDNEKVLARKRSLLVLIVQGLQDLLLGVTDLHTGRSCCSSQASVSSSTKGGWPCEWQFCIDDDDDGDDSDRNALINGNMPSKHSTTSDESQG
ncbi:hypothetical protein HPP92_001944 [Vanilla planifolia]|uniref:Uncharacterized protein n=1 Tax=Vanilla planifolia TaxID=51239 RepID=A0A835SDT3_VANPL|nr:hypothetical protein HPP92_001944 [Vanilla planifolia]